LLEQRIRRYFSRIVSEILVPILEDQLARWNFYEIIEKDVDILSECMKLRPRLIRRLNKIKPLLRSVAEEIDVDIDYLTQKVASWFHKKGYNITQKEWNYIRKQLMRFYEYIFE